jgi:hypothetical protein
MGLPTNSLAARAALDVGHRRFEIFRDGGILQYVLRQLRTTKRTEA